MWEYLCKIKSLIKAKVSIKRVNSPTSKASAKSKYEKSAATSGDDSPIQQAESITNIYPSSKEKEVIQQHKALKSLKEAFSLKSAQYLVQSIKKSNREPKSCSDLKNWLENKFEQIKLSELDPRCIELASIYDSSMDCLNQFIATKEEQPFFLDWEIISQRFEKF